MSIGFFRDLPWGKTTTEREHFKSDLEIRKGLKHAERSVVLKWQRCDFVVMASVALGWP